MYVVHFINNQEVFYDRCMTLFYETTYKPIPSRCIFRINLILILNIVLVWYVTVYIFINVCLVVCVWLTRPVIKTNGDFLCYNIEQILAVF